MQPQRWRISTDEFAQLVNEAIAEVPDDFRSLLQNIAVIVEEEPSDSDFADYDLDDDEELFGVYRGIPLPDRHHDMVGTMPDQIAIFRRPILRNCSTREEALEEIRDTVVHEIGHYFGLSDEEMPY